jgi:hypothetical protein
VEEPEPVVVPPLVPEQEGIEVPPQPTGPPPEVMHTGHHGAPLATPALIVECRCTARPLSPASLLSGAGMCTII